jgi:hypothetical protein
MQPADWKKRVGTGAGALLLLAAIGVPVWGYFKLRIDFPPMVGDDSATTQQNVPVNINLLANDADPDGSIDPSSVTITQPPLHGTATVNPVTGFCTYNPERDFCGSDRFMYQLSDNDHVLSNLAVVAVVVTPTPEAK